MNRDNHDQQMLKALQQVASNTRKIADNMEQNMFSSEVANLKLKEFKEKCLKAAVQELDAPAYCDAGEIIQGS